MVIAKGYKDEYIFVDPQLEACKHLKRNFK
jgi:hypothetical protein